jgi:hypothetical protein
VSIRGDDPAYAGGGTPQLAAAPAPASADAISPLTGDQLARVVAAALQRWAASPLLHGDDSALRQATFAIVDLPGLMVGQTIGDSIVIDPTAAGYGWFADAQASPAGSDRLDLLTVVLHEFGHVLGHEVGDLAALTLGPGVRRTPQSATSLNAEERQLPGELMATTVTAPALTPASAANVPPKMVEAPPVERRLARPAPVDQMGVVPADEMGVAIAAAYVSGSDRLAFSVTAPRAPAGDRRADWVSRAEPVAPPPTSVLVQVFATFDEPQSGGARDEQDWLELLSVPGLLLGDEFWSPAQGRVPVFGKA